MNRKIVRKTALLLAVLLLASGCSTTSAPENDVTPPPETTAAEPNELQAPVIEPSVNDQPEAEEPEVTPDEEVTPEPEPEPDVPQEPDPEPALPARLTYTDEAIHAENLERAIEYAKTIHDLYWNSETLLSSLTPQGGTPHLWPYTEQAGMVNGLLLALPAEHPDRAFFETYLRELMEGFRRYRIKRVKMTGNETWNREDNVIAPYGECTGEASYALYSSSRMDKRMDAAIVTPDAVYFDDNVWVAKEFYYAYVNLGDMVYLNEAVNIMNWILGEGYEPTEGLNGIYWKWSSKFRFDSGDYSDSNHASLNACSTASSCMVIAHLAEAMRGTPLEGLRADYLDKAEKIFRFCTEVYVDRGTKCLYDKVFLKKGFEGQTERTKQIQKTDTAQYAYNTGTYLEAAALLYEIALADGRGEDAQGYLDAGLASAKGADKKFGDRTVKKGEYSYPSHSWFTSFLVSGFAALAAHDEGCFEYLEHMRSSLNYAWANNRADDGLVCPSWIKGWSRYTNNSPTSEDNPRQILLQSANAHCYAMMAKVFE